MLVVIPSRLIDSGIYLADVFPVHHIVRFQHLHSHKVEIGSHHIVFLADSDNVWVREVHIQNRVDISVITLVTPSETLLAL